LLFYSHCHRLCTCKSVRWLDETQQETAEDEATAAAEPAKNEEDMTEEERIAQLGKPRLGDLTIINVHIRESIEFKVHSDIMQRHSLPLYQIIKVLFLK